jgi:hypothetical protein
MITLLQAPPAFTFSGNFIPLKFQTNNFQEDPGSYAYNRFIASPSAEIYTAEGQEFVIRYGSTVITLTSTSAPNHSLMQFKSGLVSSATLDEIALICQGHPQLSNDFIIERGGITINFIAKKKGFGYLFVDTDFSIFYFIGSTGTPELIRPNFAIQFDLFLQDAGKTTYTRIYTNRLVLQYQQPGVAIVDIADKLNNILLNEGPDLPNGTTGVYECLKSCRSYYFTYAESYGDVIATYPAVSSEKYTVLAGALSYLGNANTTLDEIIRPVPTDVSKNLFLKQGGDTQYIRPEQPQYLTWFNTNPSNFYALKIRLYFIDGTHADRTSFSAAYKLNGKYAFSVSFSSVFTQENYPGKSLERFECWMEDSTEQPVTIKQIYWLNYEHQQYARYFVYWSSFGTLETLGYYGKGSAQFELVQQEAKRIRRSGYLVSDGDSRMFDTRINSGFKAVTGWLTRHQLALNRDFYISSFKYRYFKEQYLPIKITSGTIPEYEDGKNNISQEFEYKYLFEDQAYTEGDVETNNLPANNFMFGGFGKVRIVDQEGNLVEEVAAPGTFQIYRFDAIGGGGADTVFELQIIKAAND